MLSRRDKILLLGEIPCALALLAQSSSKAFPVWVYIFAALVLGVLVTGSLLSTRSKRYAIVQVMALAVLVRSVYFFATDFSVMPFGDAYGEYGVTVKLLAEDHISAYATTPPYYTEPAETMPTYSGWIGTPMAGAIVTRVLGVAPLNVAIWLPFMFFLAGLLFAYLLVSQLSEDLGLSQKVPGLACLMIATNPFFHVPPQYIHSLLGPVLLLFLFYLLYRNSRSQSLAFIATLLLVLTTIVVTHHHTSVVAIVYLCSFALAVPVGRLLRTRSSMSGTASMRSSYLMLGLIALGLTFVWWDHYASVVWPFVGSFVARLWQVLKTASLELYLFQGYASQSPGTLRPLWGVLLMTVRSISLYLAVFVGAIVLWRQRHNWPAKFFVLWSLGIGLVLLAVDTFVLWAGPYRELYLFAPFFALCAGLAVSAGLAHKWRALRVGVRLSLIVWVLASLVGLWGNRYLPLNLYDRAVTWQQAGEHPSDWSRLTGFFSRVSYSRVAKVITDDSRVLGLLLPVDQWDKMRVIGMKGDDLTPGSLVAVFAKFDPRQSYINQGFDRDSDPSFDPVSYAADVEFQGDKVYSGSGFNVWSVP